ncbi:MAG: threonine/serine dehydratase [Deltaproteobacteria bacterium]|nr:threonine/serine dehydratase [Deltaproteobacteria bacterium]
MTPFNTNMIQAARRRIEPHLLRTPLLHSPPLSLLCGSHVYLKMECWQTCGCFKIRGATNFLRQHQAAVQKYGVVTASSGNHALGVAYAAAKMQVQQVGIFLPENADPSKVDKIRQCGIEPVIEGGNFFETLDIAQAYTRRTGACYVHSNADPLVISGQGTIGLEILEDLPDVDAVVVPVGGGGLISGIAAAIKADSNGVSIIGAEPEASPGAYQSLQKGEPCERITTKPSVADGLAGGLSPLPFEIAQHLITHVALAAEDEIITAMKAFLTEEQLVIEGAASVGLALLLAEKIKLRNQKVVLVVTGRNIDSEKFLSIIAQSGESIS